MDQRSKLARESALRRRAGISPERRVEIGKFLESAQDWRGRCRECGESLTGSVQQIAEHRCAR